MTMTSKFMVPRGTFAPSASLPDAELREDLLEHIFPRDGAGEEAQRSRRAVQIDQHDLLFVTVVERCQRCPQRALALRDRKPLPLVDQAALGRGEVVVHQRVEMREQLVDRIL